MYTLSTLLQRLPSVSNSRLISSGYGLWLVWNGSFNTSIAHTLHEHGLMQVVEESGQSLWVSFNSEVFRALAKLQMWSRLSELPLFCQVLPVTVLVGYDLSVGMSVSADMVRQQVSAPQDLEIWVHSKFGEGVRSVHGLSLGPSANRQGLAGSNWCPLNSDQGLDYGSPASWYGVMKPLGRLGERESIAGWRAYFSEVQGVFQRLGIKYLSDDAQGFVIFPLDNYRQMRLFCIEIASLIAESKRAQKSYWPCVIAVNEQRGMSFSMDLPSRFGLDWNRLTPDFLHMRYRDGFGLSDVFKVNEINYGGEQETLDSWCSLTLRAGDGSASKEAIEMPLPRRWLAGNTRECFYCGLKNHTESGCPSRHLGPFRDSAWQALCLVGMDDMMKGFKALDEISEPARFTQATQTLLAAKDGGLETVLVRALFAINAVGQPGLLPIVGRIKNREWPVEPSQLLPDEGFPVEELYRAYLGGDLERAKEGLREAAGNKVHRTFEEACLEGFVCLDQGDLHMAHFFWQEAARLGGTNIQQCYVLYLQARVREVEGEFRDAVNLYRQVKNGSPRWNEPIYREAVCMVKMGFSGQALELFYELVGKESHFFNRMLIDPELDRGRVHVLSSLGEMWAAARGGAQETGKRVAALLEEVPQWFDEDHAFRKPALEHLERMNALAETDNFAAFRELEKGMLGFAPNMQKQIDEEIKRIKERVTLYADRLRDVQYEAGWFPFPKLLQDFNADFNYCVQRINWTMTQKLRTADNFRLARRNLPEIEDRLKSLSNRLTSLRIVRDSTLFALIVGKTFLWLEIVGLALCILILPLLIFYSNKIGHHWLVEGILDQKWAFQKGLIFMITVCSLGLAAFLGVASFEKRRTKLFEADAERRAERKKALEARRAAARAAKSGARTAKSDAKPAAPAGKAPAKPPAKTAAKPGAKK